MQRCTASVAVCVALGFGVAGGGIAVAQGLDAAGSRPPAGPAPQFSTGALPLLTSPHAPPEPDIESSPVASGWAPQVEPAVLPPPSDFERRAVAVIGRINDWFNGIVNLEGRFLQTDPNAKQTRGRFYVQRPGLLRFDYSAPSAMRIVADGRYLSIENHDLKTIDKYPLESTPFRMLLRADVDLLRDARIVDYEERDGTVSVAIEDRAGETPGRIRLLFAMVDAEPGVEIREWIITDPQGLDTRIQLGNLLVGKEVSRDFFASATVGIPRTD